MIRLDANSRKVHDVIIETHAHFTTAPQALDAYRGRQLSQRNRPVKGRPLKISDQQLADSLQGHLDRMSRDNIDRMIFSPRASGMSHEVGDFKMSLYWAQTNNDLIARVCQMFPDKFIGGAQLPQSPGVKPKHWIGELERVVNELGFVGCNINADISGGGQPFTPRLGDEWWNPLWEAMIDLRVPGLMHATSTVDPALHLNGSHYTNHDAMAFFELAWSDLFDRYPDLKLIVPHGGGSWPFHYNRHRSLHLGTSRMPFEEAIKRIYVDTAIYDRDAMDMLIRKTPIDNILFATEPFGTSKHIDPETGRTFDDTLQFITENDTLDEASKEKILVGNALKVYPRIRP